MQHARLLGILLGVLLISAGGVFVLIQSNGSPADSDFSWTEIKSSSLLAGAGPEEEPEEDVGESVTQQETPSQVAAAPSATSSSQIQPSPAPAIQPQSKININTAGYEELQQITGVGPVLAQRILDWRNANGLFYEIEDIKQVSGIGEATFEKMRNEIAVGNVPPRPIPPPEPQAEDTQKQQEELEESVQQPPPALQPSTPVASFPININTAGFDELQAITGIGPILAQRIIDYRENISLFYYIEDIKKVNGIGDVTFEKMKSQITVGGISPSSSSPPSPPPPPAPSAAEGCQVGQVNVNTASLEEIIAASIRQIGPSRAEQLVELRPFSSLQDLTRINGISENRVQEIIEQGIACVE